MKDLIGKKFGRLTAIEKTDERQSRSVVWKCRCDCGNIVFVSSNHLNTGRKKSCNCLQKEVARNCVIKFFTKHGDGSRMGTHHRLYLIWSGIKGRCLNPENNSYQYYGKRGITVCPEWKDNYSAFKFWAILNGYQEDLTIDRIDNDGNYEPNNCQWLTLSENVSWANKQRKLIHYKRSPQVGEAWQI